MPRILFRIVNTNSPGENDFKSYSGLGQRPFRDDPNLTRLATGLSMFGSLEAARAKGMGRPWGSRGYIAELHLPDDDRVIIQKTTRDPDHFTVWGDEALIRASVTRVVPILEDQGPE